MRAILTLLSALISFQSMAQEIGGKVIDEKREPMISAVIQVYAGGVLKGGSVTDYDGNYVIKPLEPGYYDVLVIYSGYDSMFTNKVLVSPDNLTRVNFAMSIIHDQHKIEINGVKEPLDLGSGSHDRINKNEIEPLAVCRLINVFSTTYGLYQAWRGAGVTIGGNGKLYIIEDVPMVLSLKSVTQMKVRDYQSYSTFTRDDLKQLPVTSIYDIVSLLPGAYQQRRGDEVRFYGGR